METIRIGVIGGSGVYQLDRVKILEEREIDTPFGKPSDKIAIAEVGGKTVAFLPRHGKGHRLLPTEVPTLANIYALKSLGVEKVVSISAIGSLKEEIRPTDFVLPKQIIDRTRADRPLSFFGNGIVGHIAFADPFCEAMRAEVASVVKSQFDTDYPKKRLFLDETLIVMEGPQFSTRAESHLYRSWGAGAIGMTALPEAKIAREAEMCYTMIGLITDYDCWREDEEGVDVSMVTEYMKENNKTVNTILPEVIAKLSADRKCGCAKAAQFAVMTAPEAMDRNAMKKLELLYGKYWK